MELLQLRYFMLVAEHLNITKAASIAFTSQSNISKQIAQLESELEIRLLNRRNIGVGLTAEGEYFYNGLKKILSQLDVLVSETKDCKKDSVIRLGLCDSMDMERMIPNFFSRVGEEMPNLEVRVEMYSFEKIIEMLTLRTLDIGFVFSVFTVDFPGIRKMVLNRNNPMIYYAKTHPLYGKADLAPADFSEETFINVNPKLQWYKTFEILPFTPKNVIETNSLSAAFSYVQAGRGVAVFGQNQIHLGKQNLATLEIPTDRLKVGTDAIWIDNDDNKILNSFVQTLRIITNSC